MTFPVFSSWGSKNHIMVVLGEGDSQTLLTDSIPFMACVYTPALTEFPFTSIHVGRVDDQILTEDVAAPKDRLGSSTNLLISMRTCLKRRNPVLNYT